MNEKQCKIVVKRYEDEEPYSTQLEFFISNGVFSAKADIYCSVEDIEAIGKRLLKFPEKIDDEYCYQYGSEKPKDRFYRFFMMRAYTVDARGHCALQFKINLNKKEPSEGQSTFSLLADPQSITRLGNLFVKFATLHHKEFHWSNDADAMFVDYQDASF